MSSRAILVTGSTGKTGRETVRRLIERGQVVRALVHKEDERSRHLQDLGAEIVIGDLLNHDDVIRATTGTVAAYFCYPIRPGIISATAYFADAAKRAGLEAIVNMSQISAREDARSHAARDHWIAERVFDWSGVPTTHLRPTFFAQWLLYPALCGAIVEKGIIDLPWGDGRHAPIAAEDQGRLIAAILVAPNAHAGKTYTLHGPIEMDPAGIAAAISETLARQVAYQPLTIAQWRERLEKSGLPPILIQHLCEVAIDYQNGIFSGEDKIIAEGTGKAPMTVQEFVALHRDAFDNARATA